MQTQLLKEELDKLAPDYDKHCPRCGTKMMVVRVPGTRPEDGSWMYNCLNVECPYHDSEARDII